MAMLIAVVLIAIVFRTVDNMYFHWKLYQFTSRAEDFANMYRTLVDLVKYGDPQAPEVTTFCYESERYNFEVEKGDIKHFYKKMKEVVTEVLDSYDKIGERYLMSMDDETERDIDELYQVIKRINTMVRYQCWLNNGI